MRYKTMVLELLQERAALYEALRTSRTLLSTLDRYSVELKTSHEAWKSQLLQARPGSSASQIASEALEIALKELEDRLPPGKSLDGDEPFPLAEAIAFIRAHTPPK